MEFFKKRPLLIECLVWIGCFLYLIFLLQEMLIFGKATLTHDNLFWNYPIFSFFAKNIGLGHVPFWNPFEHGGEPFYPLISQSRFWEPLTLTIIFLGKFIVNDVLILYNWNRVLLTVWMAFGVYLVFRPLAKHILTRVSLVPILLFSSIFLGSFRQDGILSQFLWVPYMLYFLLKILESPEDCWRHWILLGVTIGINCQSYFFASSWLFLFLFLAGILLFKRDLLFSLLARKNFISKFTLTALIIGLMMAPNIVLFLENNSYVFPARMVDFSYENLPPQGGPVQYEPHTLITQKSGIKMPYRYIEFTGSFSTLWDFLQMIAPNGNMYIQGPSANTWGTTSEAYMYIGFLPWSIALLGLFFGKDFLKRVWIFLLIAFGLFMLGPPGYLHKFLYCIFPPLWFVRHTHTFVLFFMFPLLYFYILGCNFLLSNWKKSYFETNTFKEKIPLFLFFAVILTLFLLVLYYGKDKIDFIKVSLQLLFLPWALLFWMRRYKNSENSFFKNAPQILGTVFCLVLVGDLIYQFKKTSYLYNQKKDSQFILKSDRAIKNFSPPKKREIYPKSSPEGGQQLRYYGLLNLQPYAFSPLFEETYSNKDPMEFALKNRRWNSLLLLKDYYQLIHSNLPSSELRELFAIGKAPFQFKCSEKSNFRYSIEANNYRYDFFTLITQGDKKGVLSWSDSYDKNWKARLNGKEAILFKENGLFKAIDLPAGNHTVEFSYEPTWFIRSLMIFYGTILLSVLFGLMKRTCRKAGLAH